MKSQENTLESLEMDSSSQKYATRLTKSGTSMILTEKASPSGTGLPVSLSLLFNRSGHLIALNNYSDFWPIRSDLYSFNILALTLISPEFRLSENLTEFG